MSLSFKFVAISFLRSVFGSVGRGFLTSWECINLRELNY